MKNMVALYYLNDYKLKPIEDTIRESFATLSVAYNFKPKMNVLLKVCMPDNCPRDDAHSSNPAIVQAMVNVLNDFGVNCVVADCPYGKFNIAKVDGAYLNSGMLDVANSSKCELNRNLKTKIYECHQGVKTKSIVALEVLDKVDAIINIGKLKIDDDLGFLGASANMFGVIPGDMKSLVLNRLGYKKDFYDYCIDVNERFADKLVLNVVDAVVALEKGNSQKMLCCLGVSENAYALDCALLDMLKIERDETIVKSAQERKLLPNDVAYHLVGDKVSLFEADDFITGEIFKTDSLNKSKLKTKTYFKSHQARVLIDENLCKGCSVCSKICPTGAISMKFDKRGELCAKIDYSKCIFCFKCRTACPYNIVDTKTPLKYKKLQDQIDKQNKSE